MSSERRVLVWIPDDVWQREFEGTARLAVQAKRRATKAAPGDRSEAQRYTGYCAEIERRAAQLLLSRPDLLIGDSNLPTVSDGGSWWTDVSEAKAALSRDYGEVGRIETALSAGGGIVELYARGGGAQSSGTPTDVGHLPPAAAIWRAPDGERGMEAVRVRWEGQLELAREGRDVPIVPSGLHNRILTEGLRQFAAVKSGTSPTLARVVYRDGSEAEPFPLGGIDFAPPGQCDWPILKVALMSMRHPEMDAAVDLCWLRNRDVSRARSAAETDSFVFETSRLQLADLSALGPRMIVMLQTGLEPAVMGFYRAFCHFLLEPGGQLAVKPQYHQAAGRFKEGTEWRRT